MLKINFVPSLSGDLFIYIFERNALLKYWSRRSSAGDIFVACQFFIIVNDRNANGMFKVKLRFV